MDKPQGSGNIKPKLISTSAFKDLVVLFFLVVFVFTLSYFFNVFSFLVELFQKNPQAIVWIDEIITFFLTVSIGFAVFSWRRWLELKEETAQRIRLQEELVRAAETKAETERIICKQLHCDIEEYKKIEKDILARHSKIKTQGK